VAALPEKQLFLLPVLGALLAAVLRRPMVLFGAFVSSGILVVAFSAVQDPRLYYSWQVPALGMAAWLFSVLLGLEAEPVALKAPDWGRASRATFIVSMAALGLFCIGFTKALIATLRHLQPAVPTVANPGEWIGKALADVEAVPYAGIEGCLEVKPMWIPPDYLMRFQKGEAVSHWCPLFNTARKYEFYVFQTLVGPWDQRRGPELYGVWPGGTAPPTGKQLYLVGMKVERPLDGSAFEAIAIGDPSAPDARLLHPSLEVATQHARELMLSCSGRPR
jgi:hypothetical protein